MKKGSIILSFIVMLALMGCGNKEPTVPIVGETKHEQGFVDQQFGGISDDTLLWLNIVDEDANTTAKYIQLHADTPPSVYGFDENNECILMGDCCGELYTNCASYSDAVNAFLQSEINTEFDFDSIPCSSIDQNGLCYYFTDSDGISCGMCCSQDGSLRYLLVNDNGRLLSAQTISIKDYGFSVEDAVVPEGGVCGCGCD